MYPGHPGPLVVDLDEAKLGVVRAQGLCKQAIRVGAPGCVAVCL